MVYTYQGGLTKERMGKLSMVTIAGLLALTTSLAVFNRAGAAPALTTNIALTQAELDHNWIPDRTTPSGGYSSTTYGGRTNVAELAVDNTNASATPGFYRTEGIQRKIPASDVVKADLYVDPLWQGKQVRAGLWGVAFDSVTYDTNHISAYPIIEFTTAGEGGFTGWRVWDGVNGGWTNLSTQYKWGTWSTLSIELNKTSHKFTFSVNGNPVGTSEADVSANIGAVILNEFNYATGSPADDYAAHWSNLVHGISDKNACKATEWQVYGFKNQGACIQYLNTGKDSRPQY